MFHPTRWFNRKREQSVKRRKSRRLRMSPGAGRSRQMFESLEPRTLFSLLGVTPVEPSFFYDSTGVLAYNAGTDILQITATPLTYTATSGGPTVNVANAPTARTMKLQIGVDSTGALVGGVPGADLMISGSVDVNGDSVIDYSGVLLTAEITGFGFQNLGTTDFYDMTFNVTGGSMAALFNGTPLAMTVQSENSTFAGNFTVNFGGGAKGDLGARDTVIIENEPRAKITITPDDTNEIGDSHTFIVNVMEDDDLPLGAPGGDAFAGYHPAAGETVTIDLSGINGAIPDVILPSDLAPANPSQIVGVTDANGNITVTFTSATPGKVLGHASSTVAVGGENIFVETDGIGDNSGDATKKFVDAKIIITPDDTNLVGDDHTYTATVFVDDGEGKDADGIMGNYDAVGAGEDVAISLLDTNGAVSIPSTPLAGVTDINGEFSVTFTSLTGGVVIGSATSNVDVAGLVLPRSTDGSETVIGSGVFNSGPAFKKFVDAKIVITPDGTNLVGDPHTFTATYFVDDGTGTDLDGVMGNFDAFVGAPISIVLTDSDGAASFSGSPNGVTNGSGQFSLTFTSLTTGTTTGVATASTTIDGVDLTRVTDGSETVVGSGSFNSDEAVKKWIDVNAKITITPDDTNEVGDDHTFTINVMEDDGLPLGAPGGDAFDGFGPAAGETVTVDLQDLFGAMNNLGPVVVGVTDAAGNFTVTFTSLTGGLVVGSATSNVEVSGKIVPVATDGVGANSGPANKRFVDAKIIIAPDDTNLVGDDHTFTATVFVDDGTGTDLDGVMGNYDAVGAGEDVTITLLDTNGAVSIPSTPLAGVTDASGQFSVTFTSLTGGVVIGSATSNVDVAGLVLPRSTDGSETVIGSGVFNSGPAFKKFVDAKIVITPDGTNLVGDPHTFTATYFVDDGTGTDLDGVMGNFDAFVGAPIDIALNDSGGAVSVPSGALNGVTDGSGQFSVTFTSFTTGTTVGVATASTTIDGVDLTRVTDGSETVVGSGSFNSDEAVKKWIDVNAKITITPDDTNEVGDDHTFTINVMEDDGLPIGAPGGDAFNGFGPAAGETVTVNLQDLFGAMNNLGPVVVGVTDAAGNFTVTFTSLTGGIVVGSATSNVDVNGKIIPVATDGVGANSGPAHKKFVDAKIVINPDGTNPVGAPHTFTATYFVDDGTGTDLDGIMGHFDAWSGAPISIALNDAGGAVSVPSGALNGVTNANGQFSVTFTSLTAGTTTGVATASTTINGVALPRTTDGSETVVGSGSFNSGPALKTWIDRKIHLEKLTNGVDADTEAEAPLIAPGDTVTWTYLVTNTGSAGNFTFAEVVIVDDNGTPGDLSDDFSTLAANAEGTIITFVASSDVGNDGLLSPGETWEYTASAVAQNLGGGGGTGAMSFIEMTGNSATDGPDGNIRTFTDGTVSLHASAFSRADSGAWEASFLGAYSPGLGVTDSTEGDGGGGLHRVDNVGMKNFVVLEFSEIVVIDQIFLDSVVDDSDITIWIGTLTDPYNNHIALNDGVLSGLGYSEDNNTGSNLSRWADVNGGAIAGNVVVIAASVSDDTPEDRFKVRKVKFNTVPEGGCYENYAVVTAGGASDDDLSHYCNPNSPPPPPPTPGIDIEKFTNGVDADTEAEAPLIAPGDTVTWTYKVTNTGNVPFTFAQVSVVDDAGTPGNAADDFVPTFVPASDAGNDGILSPGEMWLYSASAVAQNLSTGTGVLTTFDFSGNSGTDGTDGNIRSYNSGGVSVNASAFSRTLGGTWNEAFLGAYSAGLGVTDVSEGDGSGGRHRVDNVDRLNYVMLEFSDNVVIDRAYLDSVVNDSDITVWIGTIPNAYNSHVTLSDAVLSGMTLVEDNNTTSSTARWADVNAGNVAGNVIIIAASVTDSTPEDNFKLHKVKVGTVEAGCYENKAVVTVPGATDYDLSHYCNPQGEPGIDIEKLTNGVDADDPADAPKIAPGDAITWTYIVTNTGDLPFNADDIKIVDDAGTPSIASDDFSTMSGGITRDLLTDAGNDGILSPGEVWSYTAMGVAQSLPVGAGEMAQFDLTGNTALNGAAGNIRSYTSNGVSVKASGFSRTKGAGGTWATAFLGSYAGGLGVTDTSEDGQNGTHRVDNVGRDNYVLFEFSEPVIVDQAFLDSVVGDSDATIWIGTRNDPFNNHVTLSDALLSSMALFEVNDTTSSNSRWADFNNGNVAGNILIISASTQDTTPDDNFKISKVAVKTVRSGCYENIAYLTAPGAGDSDASHYCNPDLPPPPPPVVHPGIDLLKLTNGVNTEHVEYAPQIAPWESVTWSYIVTNTGDVAFNLSEVVIVDDNGTPDFAGDDFSTPAIHLNPASDDGADLVLSPGEQWEFTYTDQAQDLHGGVYKNTAKVTATTHGQTVMDSDIDMYKNPPAKGKIGNYVWNDVNMDGRQDAGESGIEGVVVKLLDAHGNVVATTMTDANGQYCFENVDAGDYRVKFVKPDGYTFSPQGMGYNADNGSDADPTTGVTGSIWLDQGEVDNTIDAGMYMRQAVGKLEKTGFYTRYNKAYIQVTNTGDAAVNLSALKVRFGNQTLKKVYVDSDLKWYGYDSDGTRYVSGVNKTIAAGQSVWIVLEFNSYASSYKSTYDLLVDYGGGLQQIL